MKKYILFTLSIAIMALVSACNDDTGTSYNTGGTNEEFAELSVKTDISMATRSTKSGPVSSFSNGSRLGLFVSHIGDIDNRYDLYGTGWNVPSRYDGYSWWQEPPVILSIHPVNVYAYYPYAEVNYNPRQIPIEHTTQTDYMYSSHESNMQEANKYNPEVTLTMKHALALVQFNFYIENYPHDMVLHYVEIMNASSDVTELHSRGVMDISTGDITFDGASNDPVRWTNSDGSFIPDGSMTGDSYVRMLVMPMETSASENIAVNMRINDDPYTWFIPAGTSWKSGTKNTYNIQIIGRELHVRDVIIEPWAQGIEETYPLE